MDWTVANYSLDPSEAHTDSDYKEPGKHGTTPGAGNAMDPHGPFYHSSTHCGSGISSSDNPTVPRDPDEGYSVETRYTNTAKAASTSIDNITIVKSYGLSSTVESYITTQIPSDFLETSMLATAAQSEVSTTSPGGGIQSPGDISGVSTSYVIMPTSSLDAIASEVVLSVELSMETPVAGGGILGWRSNLNSKRQTTLSGVGFVGSGDHWNPIKCSEAALFHREYGKLIRNGRPVSVDPGVPYINMADYPNGSITTEFSIENGILRWRNNQFFGGIARFCQVNNDSVYAVFSNTKRPANCKTINLVVYQGK